MSSLVVTKKWTRGPGQNSACSIYLVALASHFDVACVAPSGSPRVANLEVALSILFTIANSQYTMIEYVTTLGIIVNALTSNTV